MFNKHAKSDSSGARDAVTMSDIIDEQVNRILTAERGSDLDAVARERGRLAPHLDGCSPTCLIDWVDPTHRCLEGSAKRVHSVHFS